MMTKDKALLYTTPPSREWQSLTKEELWKAVIQEDMLFHKAIDKALREKNGQRCEPQPKEKKYLYAYISSIHTEQMPYSNIKFTFDDDGKLIDAEFIKEI